MKNLKVNKKVQVTTEDGRTVTGRITAMQNRDELDLPPVITVKETGKNLYHRIDTQLQSIG